MKIDGTFLETWMSQPQTAVKILGGTFEVSYYHYLGSTPLVNKLWFIHPGLTLPIITIVDIAITTIVHDTYRWMA